jgi:hypothetical protein
LLQLRRPDACATCAQQLPAGTEAYWLKEQRIVLCRGCGDEPPQLAATPPPRSTAGASARAVYERKRQAREERQRERYGRIGAWAARKSAGPQHEQAWAKGSAGETENARRLEKRLANSPVTLLHDRRIPGSRANIDHIAVGPGGVTVIDSKKLEGKVRIRWHGGLLSPVVYDLYVNGRRRTNLVESVERQVGVVESVLAAEGLQDVHVAGALCMANGEHLPLIRRLKLRDVTIDGTRRVAELIARPGPLDPDAVERIVGILEQRLPPA